MDVGCCQRGFGASPKRLHHSGVALHKFFLKSPPICTNNSVRVYPIKVLKLIAYIWNRCGMLSIGVCSLNHVTTTSFRLRRNPFFLKFTPTCTHVLWHKGTPICPSTAYQGAKTHCIHSISMWDAVFGVFKPQPWHYNITLAHPHPHNPKIHHLPEQA